MLFVQYRIPSLIRIALGLNRDLIDAIAHEQETRFDGDDDVCHCLYNLFWIHLLCAARIITVGFKN